MRKSLALILLVAATSAQPAIVQSQTLDEKMIKYDEPCDPARNDKTKGNGGVAGKGNGGVVHGRGGKANGGKVVDDRTIVVKGGGTGNTIVIEKDQAQRGTGNGAGNGQAGKVEDKRDIRVEIDKGDKVVYGGKEIKAKAADVVTIHDGHVQVKHSGN